MSEPVLSAAKSGGILVTWPDGKALEFYGPGWALSAVVDGAAEYRARAPRDWPHDCIHEENVEDCEYGCGDDA